MRRGKKSIWEGYQWIIAQEKGGKVKEAKTRDKKIVMVKLMIQKEKKRLGTGTTKFQSFGKSFGVIP
jgi:hypothetical protein